MANEEKMTSTEAKKDQAGLGGQKQRRRTVCVVGHKNPDTDSICSAIAYAYLKNQSSVPHEASFNGRSDLPPSYNYVAARAGRISAETQYVLERFHAKTPILLENIGTRVKDMEIRKVDGVRSNISLKRAWTLMQEQNIFTLPITNSKNKLKGLITINDIAKSYMEEYSSSIVSTAKTPYRNILETLEAEMIVGDPEGVFDNGKVVIAAANPDVMENYIDEHDMVILGNRYEGQLCAIEMQADCIVVCLGAPVSRTIQSMARERGCTIIVTPLDTYAVARLINQSMPVSFFMREEENLVTFRLDDYTEEIRDTMSKKRYRDFPILDRNGSYVGMISRRNLLGVRKRNLILVDHNEVSQAVDNVLDAEIMEIIDHHRLGSLETINPVYFRNQPVGCTCTIIYQMFLENGVEIPADIAEIMCSAILSDTLIFRSPTCTPMDVAAATALAKIAGIECEDFAKKMFTAGSDLSTKTAEEICYQDFKKFEVGDRNIGVGQITFMSTEELQGIRERIVPFLKNLVDSKELDMVCFMMTNIIEEGTDLICFGKDAEDIIDASFHEKLENGSAYLKGVVSRKKQLIPSLMTGISQITGA